MHSTGRGEPPAGTLCAPPEQDGGAPAHGTRRQLVGSVGWLLLERLIVALVGAAVNLWVVKYLGPAQFGRLAFAISFSTLVGASAGLGMDIILVRELARHPDRAGEILGSAALLRLVAGGALYLLTVAIASVLGTESSGS